MKYAFLTTPGTAYTLHTVSMTEYDLTPVNYPISPLSEISESCKSILLYDRWFSHPEWQRTPYSCVGVDFINFNYVSFRCEPR